MNRLNPFAATEAVASGSSPIIAIDGPAGTGKSTATKRLAEALGYVHVDTGALYRAIAYLCLEVLPEGAFSLQPTDSTHEQLASEIAKKAQLEFRRDRRKNPANRILANGRDITALIRTPEVSMASSKISAIAGVREALLGLQRTLGGVGKTILEGRDIGTVVFPNAHLKFFLTASVDERAKRRLAEIEASGGDAPSFEELKRQISERDFADSNRKLAPLKKAIDAIEIDTTSLTLDQVVEQMQDYVRSYLRQNSQKS